MVQLFLTGATGFVGGDFLYALNKAQPDIEITALVRDKSKGDSITKDYPNVKIVEGDLDDEALLKREAASADIVCHLAATGHLASVKAIYQGLSDAGRSKPAFWIQISGATLLAGQEISSKTFGRASESVHRDSDAGLEQLKSLIKASPNRTVDNFVLDAASSQQSTVNTALIVGPIIYGSGRGPAKTRSVQVPELARVAREGRVAVKVNEGLNRWGAVHVHDLSDLLVALVDKAVAGVQGGPVWREGGFYFPQSEELSFADISAAIAQYCKQQGYATQSDVKSLEPAEADQLSSHASILWGTNARTVATRAKEHLGWQPSAPSLLDTIPDAVEAEK